MDELIAVGYDNCTMLGVAKRANCSKATLYDWFTDQQGLFTALIKSNGDEVAIKLEQALSQHESAHSVLTKFATGLLQLLCSRQSIALNRAATQSSELADILLKTGRLRVGAIVEDYLETLLSRNGKEDCNAQYAFTILYGLIVRDTQIRVLLSEKTPGKKRLNDQARQGVDHFFDLYGLDRES